MNGNVTVNRNITKIMHIVQNKCGAETMNGQVFQNTRGQNYHKSKLHSDYTVDNVHDHKKKLRMISEDGNMYVLHVHVNKYI